MKCFFALPLLAALLVPLHADPVKSKPTHHKAVRTRGRRARHAAGPSYQLHPDPARYAEIQKALADRGYFKGEVNGQWNDDSVDALKRFQADQKLDNDGKINSLTLIGLGLGPKHDSSLAPPTPPAPVASGSTPAAPSSSPSPVPPL